MAMIKKSRQMILSVVIINWNSGKHLFNCLNSLKKNKVYKYSTIYLVDNDSADLNSQLLKQKFPWIELILNKQNLGFSKANNQVLKKIQTKYTLMLNPDTQVLKKAVTDLIGFLEGQPKAGACSPLLIHSDGSTQNTNYYLKLPSLPQILLFYTNLRKYSKRSKFLVEQFWQSKLSLKESSKVGQLPGACFMVRTEILKKVGYFDEDYFLWFEDVDLSLKIKKRGFKLFIIPETRVIHIGGVSFANWTDQLNKEVRFYKSLMTYCFKNFNILSYFIAISIILINYVYLILTRSIKQLIKPTADRAKYIKQKTEVLKCLLAL